MCRPRLRPIALIIVAEFVATSRSSMRVFQTLSTGKIPHPGAPATVGDPFGFVGGTGWLFGSRGFVWARYSVPSR